MKEIVKVLAEHFNIYRNEIILPTPDQYDDEFTIFNKPIEVVTFDVAVNTEIESLGSIKLVLNFCTINTVGIYTRLSNSNLYFRWL